MKCVSGSWVKLSVLVALAAVVIAPGTASAGVTYTLNNPNSGISAYPGPYGTVTVTRLDSTHAQIDLVGNSVGSYSYFFGAQGIIGLNTNGAATLVSGSVTGHQTAPKSGWSPSDISSGGAGNEDGFGSFNFTLDNFDGATHAVDALHFRIQKTSGTWASDSDVLTANGGGFFTAAHVFVFSTSNLGGNALATGYSSNGGSVTAVPEPGTLLLAGVAGLCGLGCSAWRRRKSQVKA